MTLDIDQEAVEFIRGKGGVCSIRQIYVKTTFEEMPETQIEFAAPTSSVRHDVLEYDGVVLHVGRNLRFKDDHVKVRLGRFLKLRWLEFPSLTMFGG